MSDEVGRSSSLLIGVGCCRIVVAFNSVLAYNLSMVEMGDAPTERNMNRDQATALQSDAIKFGESARVTSDDIDMILDTAERMGLWLGDDEGDVVENFDTAVIHGNYLFIFGCDGNCFMVDAETIYYFNDESDNVLSVLI